MRTRKAQSSRTGPVQARERCVWGGCRAWWLCARVVRACAAPSLPDHHRSHVCRALRCRPVHERATVRAGAGRRQRVCARDGSQRCGGLARTCNARCRAGRDDASRQALTRLLVPQAPEDVGSLVVARSASNRPSPGVLAEGEAPASGAVLLVSAVPPGQGAVRVGARAVARAGACGAARGHVGCAMGVQTSAGAHTGGCVKSRRLPAGRWSAVSEKEK